MSFEMYKKEGIEFPYLIDTRYQKWTSESIVKEKYERRWVVLTSETNSFIESLEVSYKELALVSVERENRGGMCVVTAIYGEAGLTDDFLDADGELTWWTLSNGVYTYHIKRWVNNDPDSIKAFCNYCKSSYGYEDKEVSVACNPIAGESRVMCEATFSRTEEEISGDSGGDFGGDEEEESVETEEVDGIQVTTSAQELPVPTRKYIAYNFIGNLTTEDNAIFEVAQEVKAGKLVLKYQGELGGYIKEDGWYDATEDNPLAWDKPKHKLSTYPKDDVYKVIEWMEGTYTIPIICIHVSISTKKTSKDKIQVSSITGMMNNVGEKTDTISVGGASMAIPESLKEYTDDGGYYYKLNTKWVYEGASFDANSVKVKTKSKLTTAVDGTPVRELKKYYEGRVTHSYRTITTLSTEYNCPGSTTKQTI